MAYHLVENSWDHQELEALQDVIRSGHFTMGERVKQFESEFAEYFGMRHAVMVNSGSSANLIAVASQFYREERPLRAGDTVVVPGLGWSTTYSPLIQYGLKLKVVDIDIETLNIDTAQLEELLQSDDSVRLVMAVNVMGTACDLPRIQRACDAAGVTLIEDNCESCDAAIDGRKTGTFGKLSTFSFFFSHHISTMEGGMILTNDRESADICRSLRAHGWTRDLANDSPIFERLSDPYIERFRFLFPGYNVRPSELNAAVGSVQLRKLPGFSAARRMNHQMFQEIFANNNVFMTQKMFGDPSPFSFTLVIRPGIEIDRRAVLDQLSRNDIEARVIAGGSFTLQDMAKHADYTSFNGTQNVDHVHRQGFYIGNMGRDLSRELQQLHSALKTI